MRMHELAQEVARRSKTAGRNLDITTNHAHVLIAIVVTVLEETLLEQGRMEIAGLGVLGLSLVEAHGGLHGKQRHAGKVQRVCGSFRPAPDLVIAFRHSKSSGD